MESYSVLVRKVERPDKILMKIGGVIGDGLITVEEFYN